MKPLVAIVGRANVGKSRLFNRLVGATRAIVNDLAGVTRDRQYADAEWLGKQFIVIDTGGIDFDPDLDLEKHVTKQSLQAVSEADVVVLVFDGRQAPTQLDLELIQELRKLQRPLVIAVNKIDDPAKTHQLDEYYRFGFDSLFPTSAEHGFGVDDLLDEVVRHFPEEGSAKEESSTRRIAVIGRPNVGKSTFINRLAGEERVVAHETAGTTRDAIDVNITFEDELYTFVDTAGVKRGFNVDGQLEKYTALRSLRAIERSQIVCQLIDASEGLTRQDLHLAGYVYDQGKGLILLVNKWDLLETPWEEFLEELRYQLKELEEISVVRISAKTGLGCLKIFNAVCELEKMMAAKLSTSQLNKILEQACQQHHLPTVQGKMLRFYYGTQLKSHPPTFMLFSNHPELVPESYRRYLANRIAEALEVKGVPIHLVLRKKS